MKESDNNVFDGIAFSISLIAIEACLALNILFFILSKLALGDIGADRCIVVCSFAYKV